MNSFLLESDIIKCTSDCRWLSGKCFVEQVPKIDAIDTNKNKHCWNRDFSQATVKQQSEY